MLQSAAPRPIFTGARAVGGGTTPAQNTPVPNNTPHFYFFAQKGGTLPQYLSFSRAQVYYGADTFLAKEYQTHQSLGLTKMTNNGQMFFGQRVVPKDANPPAGAALWLEILNEDIIQYQRNIDNKFLVNQQTQAYIPILDSNDNAVTVPGISARLLVLPLDRVNSDGIVITEAMVNAYNAGNLTINITPVANRIGQLTARAGIRANSTMYPIKEVELDWQGKMGNNIGFNLWPVTTVDPESALNEKLVSDNISFLYRFGVSTRSAEGSTARRINTKYSGRYIDFMYKKNTADLDYKRDLWADDVLLSGYSSEDDPTIPDMFSDLGRIHIYYNDIEAVLTQILAVEAAANGALDNLPENIHLMNFLTAVDTDNSPYLAYRMIGESGGGLSLSSYKTIWCFGGTDGTMSNDTFDALVREELEGYGELDAKMLDLGRYPVTTYWDTGFKLTTKYRMMDITGFRKDIIAYISLHTFGNPKMTQEEETSLGTALVSHARSIGDSEIFSTSSFRIFIYGQSFKLIDETTRERVSLLFDVMPKNATYMGSGTGRWNTNKAYDKGSNKIVTTLKDPSISYKSETTKIKDWASGITTAQYSDIKEMMIFGYPTVYPDVTHPLNNQFAAHIVCAVNKICFRVWTELVSDQSLTDAQFIEASNKSLNKKLASLGDGRAVFNANTFITADDLNNGFSYHCEVSIGTNNAKTVGTYTPVVYRRDELLALLGGNQ